MQTDQIIIMKDEASCSYTSLDLRILLSIDFTSPALVNQGHNSGTSPQTPGEHEQTADNLVVSLKPQSSVTLQNPTITHNGPQSPHQL